MTLISGKKVIEIQFNWLFVIIAGGVIIIFFTSVIMKQKDVSSETNKATVLKGIEAIIISAGASTDTTNTINIPKSEIDIKCNRIAIGSLNREFSHLALFALSKTNGNRLIVQTKTFSAPFKATNIVYMASLNARYILIGNSATALDINKSMPSTLRKEIYDSYTPNDIKNLNDYMVRFAVFDTTTFPSSFPQALERMDDSDVSTVKITGNLDNGMVEFFEKRGATWVSKGTSYYLGRQMLLGAVYSGTKELYECNAGNAFSRLNILAKIYLERTNNLILPSATPGGREDECNNIYGRAISHLNSIHSLTSEPFAITDQTIASIYSSSVSLGNENTEAGYRTCPLIY